MLRVAECRENGDIYKEVEPGGGGETRRGPSSCPLEEREEGKGKKSKRFVCILYVGATPVSRKKTFELPEPKRKFSGSTVDF